MLERILQHVPLKHCLTCCSLVCRAWAAAAEAASDVQIRPISSENIQLFQGWLAKRRVVERLSAKGAFLVEYTTWCPLQLDFPKLTMLHSLELRRLRVQLSVQGATCSSTIGRGSALSAATSNSADSSISIAAKSSLSSAAAIILPQLQELELRECQLTNQLLSLLLNSTALSRLQLGEGVWVNNDTFTQPRRLEQVLPDIWQQLQRLPNLSDLHLHSYHLTAADVTPISKLQHLQRLTLRAKHNTIAAAVAAVVPAGLTALDVRPLDSCVGSVPLPLARLHDLQAFTRQECVVEPSSLSSLTTQY